MKLTKLEAINTYYDSAKSPHFATWKITTRYSATKNSGYRWTVLLQKNILNEWKDLWNSSEHGSEKDALLMAEWEIEAHGVKSF